MNERDIEKWRDRKMRKEEKERAETRKRRKRRNIYMNREGKKETSERLRAREGNKNKSKQKSCDIHNTVCGVVNLISLV